MVCKLYFCSEFLDIRISCGEEQEGEKDNWKALRCLSKRKKAIVKCHAFQANAKNLQCFVEKAKHFDLVKIKDKVRSSLTVVVLN